LERLRLTLSILLLFSADVFAQNYLPVARIFGVDDGLPHRQVNCILQDRQGFIWVATEAGVARFDGLRFKIFNKAENGLSSDQIRWMLEDAVGNLWLISSTFARCLPAKYCLGGYPEPGFGENHPAGSIYQSSPTRSA
jgi:ligand-binding sensor domain-containing protein